jgi:membrane protein
LRQPDIVPPAKSQRNENARRPAKISKPFPASASHLKPVTRASAKRILARTYYDVLNNQTVRAAAALSYYSILSVFPALILLSAVLAKIPLPDFFADILVAMGRVVPAGTMPVVYGVLSDILGKNSGAWLSLGTVGTLWVVSSAFDEMIDALDDAYDVDDKRPFWKTRLLALFLAAITSVLLVCTIATFVLGPRIIEWLAVRLPLSDILIFLWPYIHWALAVALAVFAVEMIYFFAPNVKQRFRDALPGAIFSVACWIALSHLLSIYFRYFSNYNRTYGALAGAMAFMTWLYWIYFILLAGGELNAEISKEREFCRSAAKDVAEKRHSTRKTEPGLQQKSMQETSKSKLD